MEKETLEYKDDDVPCLIYKHTNTINGKAYIGYTTQTIEERWEEHLKSAYRRNPAYSGCRAFNGAIRRYGEDVWTHEVIGSAVGIKVALALETEMIDTHGTLAPHGYNLLRACEGPGRLSAESKERISKSLKTFHTNHPEAGLAHGDRLKKLCEDPKVRQELCERLAQWQTEHPEWAQEHSEVMTAKMGTPEARQAARDRAIVQFSDPKANSERSLKMHADHPELGRRHSERMKVKLGTPKARQANRERAIAQFAKSGAREKASRAAIKRFADPVQRAKLAQLGEAGRLAQKTARTSSLEPL